MKGKVIVTLELKDKDHREEHKHTLNNYDVRYEKLVRAFYDLSLAAGYAKEVVDKFIDLAGGIK